MQKVIFDTDPGVDDALALYYLHRHPDVELIGITTVFGNAPVALTTADRVARLEYQFTSRDPSPKPVQITSAVSQTSRAARAASTRPCRSWTR